MAYTEQQWSTVQTFFECGLTLGEITLRPEVDIKDKGVISKKAKKEGWEKGKRATLIDTEIKLLSEKATQNATVLQVHDLLVDERIKHQEFFTSAAITNVKQAMAAPCENQNDYKARADTIGKGKETTLGKAPETQVNVQTNITRIDSAPERVISALLGRFG